MEPVMIKHFHLRKPNLPYTRIFSIVAALVYLMGGGVAYADITQQDVYTKLQLHYVDLKDSTENCGTGDSASGSVTGNDNKSKIWNYLTAHGISPVAAAGIMGNMSAESAFNPAAEQTPGAWSDMSSGYNHAVGLVQWDGSRRPAVIKFLGTKGISGGQLTKPSDALIAGELDYVLQELNGDYSKALHAMMKETDPGQAAYDFHKLYEISADSQSAIKTNRMDVATAIYAEFSDGGLTATKPTTGASAVTGSGNDGCSTSGAANLSPDCADSKGVAKILCAAKPYDPVSYVWGGAHNPAADWHRSCPTIGPSCGLDCSGLVNIAVYDAFHVDLQENTSSERGDSKHWQKIPLSQVQPGDLVQPDSGHVEIIDHVSGNRIYTFGAHTSHLPQPKQVGPSTWPVSSGNLYLHYVGPGV
jgi:cell wall-associated NlpC family hydrolase